MLVSEILRIKGTVLFTTPPDAPVLDAVKVMAQHDIGSLVVMDHGRMAGLVTFAEVLRVLADRGALALPASGPPRLASPGADQPGRAMSSCAFSQNAIAIVGHRD